MQIRIVIITGVTLDSYQIREVPPTKGMTGASAQHTAKAEFNKMSEIQNQVPADHGLSVTKITK